ncbi:CrcB family protein [Halolamina litorea]|uniref:Fluoride-specific ion channel FluC n=1 Tax=Halolamina litorea TaxID=1515593 RepID=A0ABD6BTD0_9EURY|nr:CrcB family protein [Halolamina litorea]
MPPRAKTLALVAGGGAAGALSRWGVAVVLPALAGTLAANVLGAFTLGAVVAVDANDRLPAATRLAVATGFLSSFTTYSTFAVESATAGTPALLVGNVLATYALGFAAAALGLGVGRRLRGSSPDSGGEAA